MKKYVFAFLCAACLSLPGFAQQTGQAAQEQDKNKQNQPMQSAVNSADREFMTKTAMGGMLEVKLGEMAAKQAANEEVKQFGQRMATDHGKVSNELKDLAARKGVTLPLELDAKHKAMHDRLMKLSGAEFDRTYMSEMVKGHNNNIAAFEQAAQSSRDADLKNWAAQTLPTLREHHKMARELATKVGATMAETSKNSGKTDK